VHGLGMQELDEVINSLVSVGEALQIRSLWRPLLSDPADDMVLETAVNGRADLLVTSNRKGDAQWLCGTWPGLPMFFSERARRCRSRRGREDRRAPIPLLWPQHMSVCLGNRTQKSGTTLSKMTLSSLHATRAILSGFST